MRFGILLGERVSESDANAGTRSAFVPLPEDRLRVGLGAWGLSDAPVVRLPRGASADVFRVEGPTGERWVAKYAYMSRRDFEPGLLAAGVVAAGGLRAATPKTTPAGELATMVEWPDGHDHSLALLEWVPGRHLEPTSPVAAATVGETLGRVQTLLLDAGPARLGLSGDRDHLAYLRRADQDLGRRHWLHQRIAELVAAVDELTDAGQLTWGPGVWDGPEIVEDRDGILGLLDFGNVDWQPVAHAVAYGTTQVSPPGRENPEAVAAFLAAFTRECRLATADVAAVETFRKVTIAVYAKFMATRHAAGRLDAQLHEALERCLTALA